MKKYISLLIAVVMVLSGSTVAFAAEGQEIDYGVEFEGSMLDGAIVVSEETYEEDGQLITVTKYQTKDGNIVTDTFKRSAVAPLSKEGTDDVERSRDMGDYGVVTIKASFKWYTDPSVGPFGTSYVKCTKMSATHTGKKDIINVKRWETDYSSEYKAFGKAYAQVSFYMENTRAPMQYQSDTIKITCDDTGAISDNA